MTRTLRTFRLIGTDTEVPIIEDLLREQGFDFAPEPFFGLARRLVREPTPLGESLAARFGLIYIQDRSSMLPPLLLNPPAGSAVLDMCSAPGSKTSLLSQLVGRDGFVFASEPSADRLGTLRANLRRMGCVNTATTKAKAQDLPFPDGSWSHIQLDPPCSGWGTVDKNPKVMELWAEGKTAPLVTLQKALLTRAAAMLEPGGTVLYSTCTTNVEENEEQVAWAMEALDLQLVRLPEPKGFEFESPRQSGMDGVLRVAEGSDGQGFFLARFVKGGDASAIRSEVAQNLELPGTRVDLLKVQGASNLNLKQLPPGQAYDFGGKVFHLHQRALDLAPEGLRWQGGLLGKLSGKGAKAKFRPDPTARFLVPDRHDVCLDVDDIQVVQGLLSGQSIGFAKGSGSVGLRYRGLPLTWLSRKGSRLLLPHK